ncbi:MAG TPA: hypothetical protein VFU63_12865 [Ktedonobacterales bacterium]|nr:hypothetical protein [Ktedonobacterales bacterium]
MSLLIAILLGLSGLLIVIYPLLGLERDAPDMLAGGPIAEVADHERAARDALREVEFDHRLGNLDDADYQSLRSRYERRALAALKTRYQREQELDALIEQQLDALRAQEATAPGGDSDSLLPTQASQTSDAKSGRRRQSDTDDNARPASGPRARRRRGGRL